MATTISDKSKRNDSNQRQANCGFGDFLGSIDSMRELQNEGIYHLIDESLGELLNLMWLGHRRVEIIDVIQLIKEIEDLIPEIVIDGDEFVKHFNKKHC
jgi:hypothetical protein